MRATETPTLRFAPRGYELADIIYARRSGAHYVRIAISRTTAGGPDLVARTQQRNEDSGRGWHVARDGGVAASDSSRWQLAHAASRGHPPADVVPAQKQSPNAQTLRALRRRGRRSQVAMLANHRSEVGCTTSNDTTINICSIIANKFEPFFRFFAHQVINQACHFCTIGVFRWQSNAKQRPIFRCHRCFF